MTAGSVFEMSGEIGRRIETSHRPVARAGPLRRSLPMLEEFPAATGQQKRRFVIDMRTAKNQLLRGRQLSGQSKLCARHVGEMLSVVGKPFPSRDNRVIPKLIASAKFGILHSAQ